MIQKDEKMVQVCQRATLSYTRVLEIPPQTQNNTGSARLEIRLQPSGRSKETNMQNGSMDCSVRLIGD